MSGGGSERKGSGGRSPSQPEWVAVAGGVWHRIEPVRGDGWRTARPLCGGRPTGKGRVPRPWTRTSLLPPPDGDSCRACAVAEERLQSILDRTG